MLQALSVAFNVQALKPGRSYKVSSARLHGKPNKNTCQYMLGTTICGTSTEVTSKTSRKLPQYLHCPIIKAKTLSSNPLKKWRDLMLVPNF